MSRLSPDSSMADTQFEVRNPSKHDADYLASDGCISDITSEDFRTSYSKLLNFPPDIFISHQGGLRIFQM